MKSRLLVLALLALAPSCRSVAQKTFELELQGTNAYVFRGQRLNEGYGVLGTGRAVLDRGNGSRLSAWTTGFLDFSSDMPEAPLESEDGRFSRLDLGVGLEQEYGDWRIEGGLQNFNFPNVATTSTTEVYLDATQTELWYRPHVALYYDIQNASDWYARAGVRPRYEFDRALFGELGFDLGYMSGGQSEFWSGVNEAGLSDATLSGRVTYVRDEAFQAYLGTEYVTVLASDLEAQNDLNGYESTNFVYYVGVGWTL